MTTPTIPIGKPQPTNSDTINPETEKASAHEASPRWGGVGSGMSQTATGAGSISVLGSAGAETVVTATGAVGRRENPPRWTPGRGEASSASDTSGEGASIAGSAVVGATGACGGTAGA